MEDYVIIAVICALALFGVLFTVKHFRGRGGCCGGGGYKSKRKRLKQVLYTKTFRVEGMHCEHCKVRVEEAVEDFKGLSARVDLKKGELTVLYAEPFDDEILFSKIERAGYKISKTI